MSGGICRKIERPKIEFCELPKGWELRRKCQWRRWQGTSGGRRQSEGPVSLKTKQKTLSSRRSCLSGATIKRI